MQDIRRVNKTTSRRFAFLVGPEMYRLRSNCAVQVNMGLLFESLCAEVERAQSIRGKLKSPKIIKGNVLFTK